MYSPTISHKLLVPRTCPMNMTTARRCELQLQLLAEADKHEIRTLRLQGR